MILILWLTALVQAQDFASIFRPGPSGHSALVRETFYGDASVPGSGRKLQQREWQGQVNGTVWANKNWETTAGINAQDLILHHSGPLLNPYRSMTGTVGVRRFGQKDEVRGFNMSYGSASDRPFAHAANDTLSANYFHQINSKWWGAVNWSNNRIFLNNIPLPAVFYVQEASRQRTFMVGFPLLVWRQRWANGIDAGYSGFLPYSHRAHAYWFWNDFHGAGVAYEFRPQTFFRDDRETRRDRVFFVEHKIALELQGAIIPRMLQWQLALGHAFNRSIFEAKNFNGDKYGAQKLGESVYVAGQLSSHF